MSAATTVASTLPAISPRYRWVVLSNTTIGVMLATIDSLIMRVAGDTFLSASSERLRTNFRRAGDTLGSVDTNPTRKETRT